MNTMCLKAQGEESGSCVNNLTVNIVVIWSKTVCHGKELQSVTLPVDKDELETFLLPTLRRSSLTQQR